jgi:hypothetical protein
MFYPVNGFSIHLAIQFRVFDDKSSGILIAEKSNHD